MTEKTKLKITRIVHGQGLTKNLGNYESLRVYNEIEVEVGPDESVKDIHDKVRRVVDVMNEKDFNELLDE